MKIGFLNIRFFLVQSNSRINIRLILSTESSGSWNRRWMFIFTRPNSLFDARSCREIANEWLWSFLRHSYLFFKCFCRSARVTKLDNNIMHDLMFFFQVFKMKMTMTILSLRLIHWRFTIKRRVTFKHSYNKLISDHIIKFRGGL